jgi:hypothetical protein
MTGIDDVPHAENPMARRLVRSSLATILVSWVLGCGVDNDQDDDDDGEPVVIVGGYPLGYDDLAAFAAADWYWVDETFSGVIFVPGSGDSPSEDPERGFSDPAAAVRALARGADVCGERATSTPLMVDTPCGPDGVPAAIRGGALLVFDACELPSGTTLAGTVEITSVHTTEDPTCDADTIVTVDYTATYSNFSWVEPTGMRVVIPSLVHTGRFDHVPGEPPTSITVASQGRIQRYFAADDLTSDRRVSGEHELVIEPETGSFIISGSTTVEDLVEGGTISWTSEDVRREPDCCRPVDGRLVASVNGVAGETWDLGPACGEALRDGEPDLLPGCP